MSKLVGDTMYQHANTTSLGKRRWYWPFSRAGEPLVAVDGLDLEVKKGSVTFLLGPNGGEFIILV